MADSNQLVLSEIQQKQAGTNPFAMQQPQGQQTVVSQQSVLTGDPFGQLPPQVPQSPQAQNSLQNPQSLQQATSSATAPMGSLSPELTTAMQKLDVPGHGIQLNPMGRQLLGNRLQQRYGDSYNQRPDVQNFFNMFDKEHAKYSDDSQASQAQAMAKAGRTLAALRGG